MNNLTLDYIVQNINGKLLCGDKETLINDVSTDSRTITPGTLFFALKGDNFDGHDFVVAALNQGAYGAVVEKTTGIADYPQNRAIIKVDNTLQALQQLARSYRLQFDIPVVGITGSVGKTTTKDLLAACLMSRCNTLKTPGNYNNDIGLPLTILKLNTEHQVMVLEMAMRGSGEIQRLADIARPNCAIITNVEPVHLETMGNINNICRAKCELLASLGSDGFALINGDSKLLVNMAREFPCRQYTFGYSPGCDIQILQVNNATGGINIELEAFASRHNLFLPLPAPKLATNVASAAGMAFLLGINWEDIKVSLAGYKTSSNRLNIIYLDEGGAVINDTYNANPVSMIAALEVSATLAPEKRTVAVLGDMLELGEYEISGHKQVGQRAADLGLGLLITIGNRSRYIMQGAIDAGMNPNLVHHFASKQDGLDWIKKNVNKNDIVLFKASRGMQLETLLEAWMA
ncbi:MAG: UDP-N-acetylmuramoyl-tripeptide--D-alanyl-D-alanine ligase [Syntrophomonadaceae bacterium]|jgi:UDP-N-acetylmuramoyl-tripeptide--D-alanyl-D-alanine ligase